MTDQSVMSRKRNSGSSVSSSTGARHRDEPFRVALAPDVAQLQRIAAAERHPGRRVQHLAAEVEVLIDDEHRRAEIARANRRRKARAPAADDDDIGLVVPPDGLGRRHLGRCRSRGREHRCRADTGRCAPDLTKSRRLTAFWS